MDKEQMTESTNGEKTIPHLHQMIGFCLSWGLTYAWTAKKKKEKSLISSKKKGMITTNYKMREGKRLCPSLSLYKVSKPLLLTTGTPRGSQRTMDQSTHRNLGKRRLYLSLHPDPYG